MKKVNKVIDAKTVYHGFRIAIIVSLLFSAILILLTMDASALKQSLESIDPLLIGLIIITIILNWIFAGLRLKVVVNTISSPLTLLDSIIIYLSGAFISNVTPFATGGGPFQIYFLHKKGVNIGKASTVIVTLFMLRVFYFGIASTIFLLFFNQYISRGVVPPYLFYIAFGFGFLFAFSLMFFSLVPDSTDKFIKFVFKSKRLRAFFRHNYRAKKLLVKARRELREFSHSLEVLSKYKWRLFLAELYTVLHWSTLFIIMPLILKGLGLDPNYLRSYIMQTLLYLVLPYMPTPGASGIAEVGFASLFVSYIPKSFIGLVTFFWRFVTFYIILIIGGIFALREIGRKRGNNDE